MLARAPTVVPERRDMLARLMRVLLALLLLAAPAWGQDAGVIFADDFETGTLTTADVPEGQWNWQFAQPRVSVSAESMARHRGELGLRVADDRAGGSVESSEGALGWELPTPRTGTFYLRAWVAFPRLTPMGYQMDVLQMVSLLDGEDELSCASLAINLSTRQVELDGADTEGHFTTLAVGASLAPWSWQLVEIRVFGLGTQAGSRELWFGSNVARQSELNFSEMELAGLSVGIPYQEDADTVGEVWIDDVRLTRRPLAATLAFRPATAELPKEACTAVTLDFIGNGEAGVSPLAGSTVVQLATPVGAASVHLDSSCKGQAVSSIVLETGRTSLTLYVVPLVPGDVELEATADDLHGSSRFVRALPEARSLGVGCGCASLPAELPLAALLLGRLLRRSRPLRLTRSP
jgi:uncharacterized protein (TIGR03382 family)